jgi:uncharacterized DUF497 family protein
MKVAGFEWDQGNQDKCQKHGLSIALIESIFDRQITLLPDDAHSESERRFRAIGKTADGLYLSFSHSGARG